MKNNFPKDMNDPQWFDRNVNEEKEIVLPEWLAMIVFFPAVVFQFLANSFSEIGKNVEKFEQAKAQEKAEKKKAELTLSEINANTSSLERR